ncbi:hypothetical protein QJS04_geneDACA000356 [Acorus gramineus]|uniref:Nucleolar/coiled-body phosphoprotein n=1 Tax=Acorus gramineus TaxID=55184 RepID=A0AAV9ATJ0_ACOGR|nr:hypothetical protein QJS04_geneDACA000356 [Acorus gramineus]
MADDLFLGLPPPSSTPSAEEGRPVSVKRSSSAAPAPAPALKSVLKREKPPNSKSEEAAPQKRLRFKTTVDASETQIIEAMQKIASHIKNPSKFSKASKLALQLIQAGSVKPGTSDHFFAILETAMSSPSACTDASVRADYQALFTAVQDVSDCLNKQQRNQLSTWTIRAVVANDLYTDDSFVFSKAAGKIKDAIASLPTATEDDDVEEATSLAQAEYGKDTGVHDHENLPSAASLQLEQERESDPFGLDELLPNMSKKEDKTRKKESVKKMEEEEQKKFLTSQREALILCLEIAARRYKLAWAQTIIDILVKHAFDNVHRFTSQQREAIEKLWASIRDQQIRRKQGKSVTGKLDMNAFESLQAQYATQKISIRHAVGGGGERRCEQWLG